MEGFKTFQLHAPSNLSSVSFLQIVQFCKSDTAFRAVRVGRSVRVSAAGSPTVLLVLTSFLSAGSLFFTTSFSARVFLRGIYLSV